MTSGSKRTFLNYAVAIFFLVSPIESLAIFEGFSIVKISAIIVFLGWMTQGFKTKRSQIINSFLILACYASLSTLWAIDRTNTFNQVCMFLWPSIIVAVAMNYSIRTNEDIYFYLKAFIIGCLIATFSAWSLKDATLAAAEFSGQERLTAMGQDQNTLAYLLCVGFTIVLDYFRRLRNSKWKYVSLAILVSFVIIILFTGSRTGLILVTITFGLYCLSIRNFKNLVLIAIAIVLLSPIIYQYIPVSLWERFSETGDLVQSGNFSDRGHIWESGLKAFSSENILLGVGYSNFSTMLRQHYGWQMASHNTYLSYLVDLGIIGFVIFINILIKMMKSVKVMHKQSKDIYVYAYIIPFLLVMFVLETEYKRWLFMLGVMLEAYCRLNYISRNSR